MMRLLSLIVASAAAAGRADSESALAAANTPTPSGAESIGLKVGDDVRHSQWGEGVIVEIDGVGDKAEASVHFPSVGPKRLLLSWAPLEKI